MSDSISKLPYTLGIIILITTGVAGFSGGSGTSSDPYQVSTCQELQDINNNLTANYLLTQNINCTNTENWNNGKGFQPIGSESNEFTGILNGNGHTIQNLTINRPDNSYTALIAATQNNAQIKNLGITNANITAGNDDSGILIGETFGTPTINNTYTTGNITGGEVAGIIGDHGGGTLKNSYTTAKTQDSGALVYEYGGKTKNSYYNTNKTENSEDGTRLTTTQMQGDNASTNMDGLNFTTKWAEVLSSDSDTTTDGYPILRDNRKPQVKAQGIYNTASTNKEPVTSNPTPNNTNIDPTSGVELSLEVGDPENDQMNLTFYRSSDNSMIGEKNNIQNGSYSTIWTSLSTDTTYNWYAEVTDGSNTVTTDIYSFSTIDINLNWNDQSQNEDGFRIYSNASGELEQVKTVSANKESTEVYNKGLEFGKNTAYEVTAYNEFGESEPVKAYVEPE